MVVLAQGGGVGIRAIQGQQLKFPRQMSIQKKIEEGGNHQAPGQIAAGAEQDKLGVV